MVRALFSARRKGASGSMTRRSGRMGEEWGHSGLILAFAKINPECPRCHPVVTPLSHWNPAGGVCQWRHGRDERNQRVLEETDRLGR